ncbi:hypothetical protein ABBQ38_009972 [Trebouxia sp. C0009 RCD-2024]
MSSNVLTFVIVGHDDHPIFEADLAPRPDGREAQGVYLHQFVLHAALDAVNEQLWTTTSMHLGNVDKFNNLMVAAYVTAAHVKFLLLHDGKNDEAIRLFFKDVYDIYVRVCMNPFFTTVGRVASPGFGQKVRILAKTHFRT